MSGSVSKIVASIREESDGSETNDRGNTIRRWWCRASRYDVDFADDYESEGWAQYDTDQDAEYFGVWVNRSKRLTLTYAEGDWTLIECPDDEHYCAEIEDAHRFYGEGKVATAYDTTDGSVTVYRQDRSEFTA